MNDFSSEEGPQTFSDNQPVVVAGVIDSHRTRTTKNNSLMCYVQLEDDSGTMELIVFQKALDLCGSYIVDNQAVLVRGKISVRDEKEAQIMVDSIRPLSDLNTPGGVQASAVPAAGQAPSPGLSGRPAAASQSSGRRAGALAGSVRPPRCSFAGSEALYPSPLGTGSRSPSDHPDSDHVPRQRLHDHLV